MISTSLSFAQAKAPFIDSGFPVEYLHPVIPPGAALSGRSRIQWSDRGKQPGRYLDSRVWCGLKDWAKAGLPEKDPAVADDWPTGNIGLRAKMFPAIDIDTSTPDALALVEALVKERFGADLAARTRGDAPRVLYPFRLAEDRDCFRKHKVEWTDSAGTARQSTFWLTGNSTWSPVSTRVARNTRGAAGASRTRRPCRKSRSKTCMRLWPRCASA